MKIFSIDMKHFTRLTIWLLCLAAGLNLLTPAYAGGWELVRYERNAQYENTDIAVDKRDYVYSEQHHNKTTTAWDGDKEVYTHNGAVVEGSAASSAAQASVQLWWNNGRPQFRQPIKAGVAPATSSGTLSITPVFRWKRGRHGNYQDGYTDDPDDNPPDVLYYTEVAQIYGSEGIRQWDGNDSGVPYPADDPFLGKYFTFSNVKAPFGNNTLTKTTDNNGRYAIYQLHGQQVIALSVGAKDEVQGETRTFQGTIDINAAYGNRDGFDNHGYASLSFGYTAAPISFQLDVGAPSIQWRNVHPTKRELDAYASKQWTGAEDPGAAIGLTWIGAASYTANLSSNLLTQLGTPEYRWTLSNNLNPNDDPVDTATVHANHNLGSKSVASKSLNLHAPATSTAKLVIGGSNADSEILTATANINWYQRPFTKYRSEIVTEVINYNTGESSELNDVMNGGNALTTEEERDLDAFTEDYDAMEKEFVTTGAQLVGSALEVEMMVGSWFVPDEVDIATALAGKPLKELYKVGKTLKATAEVGARINRMRDKLAGAVPAIRRKLGHSNFAIVMKRKKYRVSREGHIGPNGQRVEAQMGELKEEEEILCNVPGGACFVKGTLVATQNGLRAIETLQPKELVWSRDESSGKTQLKPIAQTFERYSTTLALTFSNGETVETTSEHPFYVVGLGFVKAGELGIGSSIVTRAGPSVSLTSVKAGAAQTVYNFEVAEFHTYFVGQGEVWVHNTCPGNFGEEDMALGLHEFTKPTASFPGKAKTGFTIKQNPGESLIDSIFRNIDETVAAGGKIRFNVDSPFDPKKAFDTADSRYSSYTSQELRYVLQNHSGNVVFYQNGQAVSRAQLGI